jgi:hypothetical protein
LSGLVRPEVLLAKCVGVEAAPVDLHAQQFFQSDIAEPNPRSEMIQERKLAGLVGRFECHGIEAEFVGEPVCQRAVEVSSFVEKPDSLGALPGLHHQFSCAGVQPAATLSD